MKRFQVVILAVIGILGVTGVYIMSQQIGDDLAIRRHQTQLDIQKGHGQDMANSIGKSKELRILGRVPAFNLKNQFNQGMDEKKLRNKIWVASFIFTSCRAACPMISLKMARLQEAFSGSSDVGLLSFSVDPTVDTPKVLNEYAERFQAKKGFWHFLTGKEDLIHSMIQKGFYLPSKARHHGKHAHHKHSKHADSVKTKRAQSKHKHDHHHEDKHKGHSHTKEKANNEAWEPVHSDRFVLLDQKGQIRGYYQSNDSKDLENLVSDIKFLQDQ